MVTGRQTIGMSSAGYWRRWLCSTCAAWYPAQPPIISRPSIRCAPICLAIWAIASPLGTYRLVPMLGAAG